MQYQVMEPKRVPLANPSVMSSSVPKYIPQPDLARQQVQNRIGEHRKREESDKTDTMKKRKFIKIEMPTEGHTKKKHLQAKSFEPKSSSVNGWSLSQQRRAMRSMAPMKAQSRIRDQGRTKRKSKSLVASKHGMM